MTFGGSLRSIKIDAPASPCCRIQMEELRKRSTVRSVSNHGSFSRQRVRARIELGFFNRASGVT